MEKTTVQRMLPWKCKRSALLALRILDLAARAPSIFQQRAVQVDQDEKSWWWRSLASDYGQAVSLLLEDLARIEQRSPFSSSARSVLGMEAP